MEIHLTKEELDKFYQERIQQPNLAAQHGVTPWKNDRAVPPLEEFMHSPFFWGVLPPLTEGQLDVIKEIIGPKPGDIFRPWDEVGCNQVLVFEGGKGTGKNFGMNFVACLGIITLLMLRAPRCFLEGRENATFSQEDVASPLKLINVSTSAGQAQETLFTQVSESLKRIPFIQQTFKILDETERAKNKWVNVKGDPKEDTRELITFKTTSIDLPNNISFVARPSLAERSEGGNVALWLFDEVSGFVRAHKGKEWENLFSTLTTSSSSRYGRRSRGILASYPREEIGDPIVLLGEKAKSVDGWIHRRLTTLEGRKDKYGEPDTNTWTKFTPRNWEGEPYYVPPDLVANFQADQATAEMIYLLHPPKVKSPFIDEFFVRGIFTDNTPRFRSRPVLLNRDGHQYTGVELENVQLPTFDDELNQYALAVDTSLTRNRTIMMLGHTKIESTDQQVQREGSTRTDTNLLHQKVYVDGICIWEPKKDLNIKVSLIDNEDKVIYLAKTFNTVRVEADRWEPSLPERLREARVKVEPYRKKLEDWERLRSYIVNNLIEVCYSRNSLEGAQLYEDLVKLKRLSYTKVGFEQEGESPDIADTLVLLLHILATVDKPLPKRHYGVSAQTGRLKGKHSYPTTPSKSPKLTTKPTPNNYKGPTVWVGRKRRR